MPGRKGRTDENVGREQEKEEQGRREKGEEEGQKRTREGRKDG
jgi:hypothetical protein